jgi:hypothetical protein
MRVLPVALATFGLVRRRGTRLPAAPRPTSPTTTPCRTRPASSSCSPCRTSSAAIRCARSIASASSRWSAAPRASPSAASRGARTRAAGWSKPCRRCCRVPGRGRRFRELPGRRRQSRRRCRHHRRHRRHAGRRHVRALGAAGALAEGARPGRAPVLRGPGAAIDCSRKLRRASPRPDFRHSISALELQHGARNQASRKSEIANVLDSKGKVIAA